MYIYPPALHITFRIKCFPILRVKAICLQSFKVTVYNVLLQGNVSSYLVKKHGFSPRCKVIPFTQDTLDSLVGLGVKADDVFVSINAVNTHIHLYYK